MFEWIMIAILAAWLVRTMILHAKLQVIIDQHLEKGWRVAGYQNVGSSVVYYRTVETYTAKNPPIKLFEYERDAAEEWRCRHPSTSLVNTIR